MKDESEVSTIGTVDPEMPQKKRCGAVGTAWMVGVEFGDMVENIELVVEFGDADFFDLHSNVFLKNFVSRQPYGRIYIYICKC